MKLDVILSTFDTTPAELVDAVRMAEEAGFAGAWIYDHLAGEAMGHSRALEVWSMLGAIAVSTRTIEIGPMVTNVTVRHPGITAVAAATVQQLSGGRLNLGVGAGSGPESQYAAEVIMLGMKPLGARPRRQMVAEGVELMRAIWEGREDLDGEYFGLHGARTFLRPDVVPKVIVGANGPRMAALAGRVGDGVNLHSYEKDLEGLLAVAAAAATEAGRDDFLLTVEQPYAPAYLDPDSPEHRHYADMGVDRLVLTVPAPHLGTLTEARDLNR